MPELPEVEMVARHLRALIAGRTFVRAQLRRPGLAPENSPRQFALWLKGARVSDVTRRGKHILMHFDNAPHADYPLADDGALSLPRSR